MNWNDYRTAMDELPISESFEQRVCAATQEVQERMVRDGQTVRDDRPCSLPKRRTPDFATRVGALGKAAALAAICLALGGTAYAVANLDDLASIAADANEDYVANVFAQGDGVRIDETQRVGDFNITLLGIASGRALEAFTEDASVDRTYVVLSLMRSDGKPLDETYLAQSHERWLKSGIPQEDGSIEVDASALPAGEEGFEAATFLIDNLCLTPIAATSDGAHEARGSLGYTTYAKDGAIYLVADLPATEGDAPVNYLAVWLGAYAGSDLPRNRFEDRVAADEQGAPMFAEGITGALFELSEV